MEVPLVSASPTVWAKCVVLMAALASVAPVPQAHSGPVSLASVSAPLSALANCATILPVVWASLIVLLPLLVVLLALVKVSVFKQPMEVPLVSVSPTALAKCVAQMDVGALVAHVLLIHTTLAVLASVFAPRAAQAMEVWA